MLQSFIMTPSTPTPEQLQKLLLDRLNLTEQEQKDFLLPEYKIGDLSLFEDMELAINRIYKAIKNNEQIGIYSDYDCDGIPGAVILVDFFKALGYIENIHIYIPDRHDEGYGLSVLGINELQKKNVSLVITVDLGITAISEVLDAQNKNIDIIVTDHHAPLSEYPAALAVVHPNKGTYPNQDPCGATMAFYLVSAFLQKHREEFNIKEGFEKWSLDMVGFATLADMVPLIGENRMLASYGMMVMKKTRRMGLQTLFAEQRMNVSNLIETDLTFTIAPRLNAASRMATPMLAFELLSTEDRSKALNIVKELEKINNERKIVVARIVKDCHKKLDSRLSSAVEGLPGIVVIGDLSWRPAVLGLVANKLQEKYNKSFFVWGESGDSLIKGSCRMLDEHHAAYIFQALPEDVLLHAGGHQAAGGFAVDKEKIHFLEEELNKAVKNTNYIAEQKNTTDDIVVNLGIVTTRHLQKLRTLAPFGVGNTQPLFLFENVKVLSTKMFGKNKEHLECNLEDAFGKATAFNFFTDIDMKEKVSIDKNISFLGTLEAGWRGGVRVRIQNLL